MICPGCGKESVADSLFCTYCGVKIRPDVRFDDHRLNAETQQLRDAVSSRKLADRIIPPWIVIVPLIINITVGIVIIAVIMSAVFSYDITAGDRPTQEQLFQQVRGAFVIALAGNMAFYGLFAALTYLLVDRSNKHVERERRVRDATMSMLRKIEGVPPGDDRHSLWRTYDTVPERMGQTVKRNPVFWALVMLLPLLGSVFVAYSLSTEDYDALSSTPWPLWLVTLAHVILMFYILHFMTSETFKHDWDWNYFATGTRVSLARAGVTAGMLEIGTPLQERPTWLYILLSFLTAGLFTFYWWYVVIKDSNTHYEKQARFEDHLLKLISGGR